MLDLEKHPFPCCSIVLCRFQSFFQGNHSLDFSRPWIRTALPRSLLLSSFFCLWSEGDRLIWAFLRGRRDGQWCSGTSGCVYGLIWAEDVGDRDRVHFSPAPHLPPQPPPPPPPKGEKKNSPLSVDLYCGKVSSSSTPSASKQQKHS